MTEHVYAIPHASGEPCIVADLLAMHFGPEFGEWLLWNRTCFPFSDEQAYEQAKELIRTGTWKTDEELFGESAA